MPRSSRPSDSRETPIDRSLLVTREAAAYCGYATTGALRKAYLDGRITPVAKRGGVGTWVWHVRDLDALIGYAGYAGATAPNKTDSYQDVLMRYMTLGGD